jgi:hypothetical protein
MTTKLLGEPMERFTRCEGLATHEVGDELVIYDRARDVAHRLSGAAAVVWRCCGGSRSAAEIVTEARHEWGVNLDEGLVRHALDRLVTSHLLEEDPAPIGQRRMLSRRDVLARAAVIGTAAVGAPILESILVPPPAAALSAAPEPPDPPVNGRSGTVTSVTQPANVQPGDGVSPGGRVETGTGGGVELQLTDGSILRIGGDTTIVLDEYAFEPPAEPNAVVRVTVGVLRVITGAIVGLNPDRFRVRASRYWIGIRGTDFEVRDLPGAPFFEVQVFAGSIDLTEDGTGTFYIVEAGQTLQLPNP